MAAMALMSVGELWKSRDYALSRAILARALMEIGRYRADIGRDRRGRSLLRCVERGYYRVRGYLPVDRSSYDLGAGRWRLTSIRVRRSPHSAHPTIRLRFIDERGDAVTVSVMGLEPCWREADERER